MASVEQRSASGKKAATVTSMMEKLPKEVMLHLLGFSSLLDHAQLASCNTLLDKLVYKDCPELWMETAIDLSKQESLTDEMLATLLTRISHRVKSLDIRHCNKLTGAGLAPLRHSKVFEKIYMHGIEETVDAEAVVPVLRTILPYKLFHVGVNLETIPDVMKNFVRDMHTKRFDQADEKGIQCASCQESVVDREARDWLSQHSNRLDIALQCAECTRHYCFDPSFCPLFIWDCDKCGERGCGECNTVKICDCCCITMCGKCYDHFVTCTKCNDNFCRDCAFIGIFECNKCGKAACESCKDDPLYWCEGCETLYCKDCKNIEECVSCCEQYCDKCSDDYITCSQCESGYVSCKECHSKLGGLCAECFENPRKKAKIDASESD